MNPNADERRMYGDLAWLWPFMGGPSEYVQEAEEFTRWIRTHSQIEARTLLNLGCGGGHNDCTLKNHFQLTGVDLSEGMLANARRLNPEVEYWQGDMRTVRLGRTFDAVMVADSIDYMLTEADLRAAFETAIVHLKPGGVFCTYAEDTTERFQQNSVKTFAHNHPDVDVAFFQNAYDPDPTDSTFECTFVWLIRRNGRLEIETDRHVIGLFPLATWVRLLKDVGFTVNMTETSEDKIPAFVCLRQ